MAAQSVPLAAQVARLRAELDVIMLQHSIIRPRGWYSERQREELHHEWDEAYDRLIALRALAALEDVVG